MIRVLLKLFPKIKGGSISKLSLEKPSCLTPKSRALQENGRPTLSINVDKKSNMRKDTKVRDLGEK